jgi:hypothetical protein
MEFRTMRGLTHSLFAGDFMKSNLDRYDDCVNYIYGMGKAELAQHIGTTIVQGNASKRSVGGDIALGSRPDNKADADFDDNTRQRRALRALLLCQRVYFSKLWAHPSGLPATVKLDSWPEGMADWKATRAASVTYWRGKSEAEIQEGILTFAITSGRADSLATAATAPGDALIMLPKATLTRLDDPFPGHKTCYSAVMYWLFRSGIVSYRWMMTNFGTPGPAGLRELFGPAQIIWAANRTFLPTSHLPAVERGYIVHLYVDTPGQFGGHWLVATGDGHAYGRNNDQEGGLVERAYALCSLDRQFLAYKENEHSDLGGADRLMPGIAEKINPLDIPNRI